MLNHLDVWPSVLLSLILNLCLFLQAATKLLDEMCHLTAQSLTAMDTSEHFQVLKLLGEGSYGKVMLAVHRKRGENVSQPKTKQFHETKLESKKNVVPPVSLRNSNGVEALPTGIHLTILLPQGVQSLFVFLYPSVSDQSSGNRLLHAVTLHLRSASQPLWWSLRCNHTRGMQLGF